jgi:hypothetical protein
MRFILGIRSLVMITLVITVTFTTASSYMTGFLLPSSAFSSEPTPDISISASKVTNVLTLQVSSISPQGGAVLTNFPTSLEVKITRGSLPEEGASVQFWMEGGSADAFMHNAGLTMTNSSGYAHLTLLNPNTLDPGQYIWYASAYKTGFKGGSSKVISFVVPLKGYNGISSRSVGTVTTDQKKYSVGPGNVVNVVIYGNVNNYNLGQPIVLKITSPSGKVVELVTYGTYLGAFQKIYKVGQDSENGSYTVAIYHNYAVPPTSIFYVVK